MTVIQTVAAVIEDARGHVLLVRKRGQRILIQPGGKPEPGEAPLQTLARELDEELGVALEPGSAVLLGIFEDDAVNEPNCRVRATVFVVRISGEPAPRAEIEAAVWVDPTHADAMPIAPLSRLRILPALLRARRDGDTH